MSQIQKSSGWKGWALAFLGCWAWTAVQASGTSSLDQVFVPDTLDAQVAYVEHQIGPAWQVNGAARVYKVGPCRLTLTVDQGVVIALETDVNAQCNPNLAPFLSTPKTWRPAGQTFGDVAQVLGDGDYSADCLSDCGNAADPNLFMRLEGFRANGFIDLVFTSPQTSDAAIQAAQAWASGWAKRHGEDSVIQGDYNCQPDATLPLSQWLAPAPIGSVQVGRDLNPVPCPGR